MYLDEYFFRLERHNKESMSAWSLREENVYLQMTRALTRLERTAEALEPDWAMLHDSRQSSGDVCVNELEGSTVGL